MKQMKKTILYAVTAGLCCWYLLVVWWILHPQVPVEYRLYYQEQTLKDWPGYDGLRIPSDRQLFFGTDAPPAHQLQHRGSGWGEPEADGAWMAEKRAHLFFVLEPARPQSVAEQTITLRLHMTTAHPQTLTLFVNHQPAGHISLTPSAANTYEVQFPLDLQEHDGLVHLTLERSQPPWQENDDAIFFHWLLLHFS